MSGYITIITIAINKTKNYIEGNSEIAETSKAINLFIWTKIIDVLLNIDKKKKI